MSRRSFAEIARLTAFDIHPPLYYWLLKIWVFIFGDTEAGLRSLSALLGIGLVYLIWLLGTRLFNRRVALIATLIAAVSPMQIYYSQEARMYMLLTLLGGITILATSLFFERQQAGGYIYIMAATAGLYTHYAYPVILLTVNLAALFWLWHKSWAEIKSWAALQIIPLLFYLPWLPIAWRQITTWPTENHAASLPFILGKIASTLLFGLSWPFNMGMVAAVLLGVVLLLAIFISKTSQKTTNPLILILLWFLSPVILTIFVYSPSFLKFLLVATPALALLLAVVIDRLTTYAGTGYIIGGTLLFIISGMSSLSVYYYHTNPIYARDNYRAIAGFIKAVGGVNDAVILNAEGQQEVFNYYYKGSKVYPLPRRRPLNEAETLAELQNIAASANEIYAVYWATQQADPNSLIEGWLNNNLFKATDRWYGNVRLVSYASPHLNSSATLSPVNYRLGQYISLTSYAVSSAKLTPGDILQISLNWETNTPLPSENLTVFLQLLNQANRLVGQTDAQPLVHPSAWTVNEPVADAHGIFVEPGTPPGLYRLIVGLYDSETGQRLPLILDNSNGTTKDFIELTNIELIRPASPLPLEAFDIQKWLNINMSGLTLLGYDLYKLGYRSTPDSPLHPGDPVRLTAYWQVVNGGGFEDKLSIQVVDSSGHNTPLFFTFQPAGTDYPISKWQKGEIIRSQYDFFLTALKPGSYRLTIALYTGQGTETASTSLFQVE